MKNIILIGMPGSGKTTIGRMLTTRLSMEFFDCDIEIAAKEGRSIPQIFEENGEEYFRSLETDLLENYLPQNGYIISTGGGIVEKEKNIELLRQNGMVVFINRPTECILRDIDISNRPLLKDNCNKLNQLFKRRCEIYKRACHTTILNTKDINDAVNQIIDEVKKNV